MPEITQDTRVPQVTFGHDYGRWSVTVLDHDGLSTLNICRDCKDVVVRALAAAHRVYKNEEALADKLYTVLLRFARGAQWINDAFEAEHRDVIDQALAAYQEARRA